MKHHGGLPDLGPSHDVLPFARVETGLPDVVLHHVAGLLAFEVGDFGVNDEVLLAVHFIDAEDDDVCGVGDDFTEGKRHLHVGAGGQRQAREEEQERGESECERGARASSP